MADEKSNTRPFWKFTGICAAIVGGAAALNALGIGIQKVAVRLSIPERMATLETKVASIETKIDKVLLILQPRKK